MRSQLFITNRCKICRRNIKNCLTSFHSFILHAECCPCTCHNNGCCKFRIRIKLKAIFNNMIMLQIPACLTASNYKTAMWNTTMILLKFFFGNKVNNCIIIRKLIWHGLNFLFNLCLICAFLSNHEAFSDVLFACGKFRIRPASYRF